MARPIEIEPVAPAGESVKKQGPNGVTEDLNILTMYAVEIMYRSGGRLRLVARAG